MSLRASSLIKRYGARAVVNGVSIEVNPGEIIGLLGPNGAGKTTTFYMIVGLIRPDQGTVSLDQNDLTSLPTYKRARVGIGYLAQEPSIFRKMSVEDNLKAILEYQPLDDHEKKERTEQLLTEFGLVGRRYQLAETLSGGEKRRCEIARALTTRPQMLLLDEPFVGIDPITVADIQNILQSLKRRGLGLLITDHNVQATLEIVDRAYIIYDGKILTEGPAKELLQDEQARRFYLGDKFKL